MKLDRCLIGITPKFGAQMSSVRMNFQLSPLCGATGVQTKPRPAPRTLTCPSVHFSQQLELFQSKPRSPGWPSPSLRLPTLWPSLSMPSSSFSPFSMWVFCIFMKQGFKFPFSFAWHTHAEIKMGWWLHFQIFTLFLKRLHLTFTQLCNPQFIEFTLNTHRSLPLTSWKRITRTL